MIVYKGKASALRLDLIDEIISEYDTVPKCEVFVNTVEELKKCIEYGGFPSLTVLSHIFQILQHCKDAMYDNGRDRQFIERDLLENEKRKKDENGKMKPLCFHISYMPPPPPAPPPETRVEKYKKEKAKAKEEPEQEEAKKHLE